MCMKNVLNIMKYSFKGLRVFYFIELIVMVIGVASSKLIADFTGGWDIIALVSVVFTTNFIGSIILFSTEISKDNGRLLFLTPIKGIEFIIGNLLQLMIVDLGILFITLISNVINTGSVNIDILLIAAVIAYGLLLGYLVITSLIAIIASYIKNTFTAIVSVILTFIIGSVMYEIIASIILWVLPYVYMTIGNRISIDVLSVILSTVTLIALQVVAAKHIDKKLDIA